MSSSSGSSSDTHYSSKDNDRPDPQSTEGIATPVDIDHNNNHSKNSNTWTRTPPANRGRNEQELLYSTHESSSSSSSSESLVGTNIHKNNNKRREYGGDQKRPAVVVVPASTNQSGKFIDLVANASPLSQLEIDSSIADFVQESLLPPPPQLQQQRQQQHKKQQARQISLPTAARKSLKKVVPKNFRLGNTTSTTTAIQRRKKPPDNTLARKKTPLTTSQINRHTQKVVATKKTSTTKTQPRSSAETNLAKLLIAVSGRTNVMNHPNEEENRMDNNGDNNDNNNEIINGNDDMDSTSESSAYDDEDHHHHFNQTNSSHASAEDVIDEMWPTLSKVSQRLLSNEDNHRLSTWSSLQQQHAPNNNNNNNNPSTIITATKSRRGGHVASVPTKGTTRNIEDHNTTTGNNRKRKHASRSSNNNNDNETNDAASQPNYSKKTANVFQGLENERFAQQPYHPDAAIMNHHHHHHSSSPFYPFSGAGTNPPHSSYSPYLHHHHHPIPPHNNTMMTTHLLPTTYSTAENNNDINSATQITGTISNHPNNNSNSNSSNNSSNNNNNAKSILALRERMHTFASAYPQHLHHVTNELPPSTSITYQEYLTGSLNSSNDNMNTNPYATIATTATTTNTTAPITRTASIPTTNATNARRKQSTVTTTKNDDLYESKLCSGNSMASNKSLNSAEGIHRRLVSAIFEIGISHASPAVIMENMVFPTNPAPDMTDSYGRPHDLADDEYVNAIANQVTSERVKSHLQKYRKNKQKNKDDFVREYDQWTQNALQSIGGFPTAVRTNLVNSPIAVLEMIKSHTGNKISRPALHQHMGGDPTKLLLGGELPAYLTFNVMLEEAYRAHVQSSNHDFVDDIPYRQQQKHQHPIQHQQQIHSRLQLGRINENSSDESSTIVADPSDGALAPVLTQQFQPLSSANEYTQRLSGAKVILPTLTEEESQSSLGVSISHVIGLFYSMSHALIKERKRGHYKNAPAAAAPPPSSHAPTRSDQQRNNFSNTGTATDNSALPVHTNRQQRNLTPTRGNSSGPKAHLSAATAYDLTESPESTKKTTKTIRKLAASVSAQPQEKHASLQGRPNSDNNAYNSVNDNSGSLAALNRNTNALSAIGRLHNMQQQPSRGMPPSLLYHASPLPITQPQPHGYAVSVPQHQHPPLPQQQQYSQQHALQQQQYNSSAGLVAAGGMGMMGRYAYHPIPAPLPPQYLPRQGQQNHEPPQRHWEHSEDKDNVDNGKNT